MVSKEIETIEFKANSNKEFFLIHGYTGSPTDFNGLSRHLHEKFNANVKVILLKGHGTRVEDLNDVTYEDLLKQIERELKKDIRKGRKIIVGGLSMGGLFSLLMASKYPVEGVFNICAPYKMKFPFNIPGMGILGWFKKYWKKHRHLEERIKRKNTFSYEFMHSNGLKISKQINLRLKKQLKNLNCPILTIHSSKDPFGGRASARKINNSVRSSIRQEKVLRVKVHNLFFSNNEEYVYEEILKFVEENKLFGKRVDKVAAIIPAFNEGLRIGSVLDAVTKSKIIDEIIVVDDASTDNTSEVVKKYKKVKYARNQRNLGKAQSMERGVSMTKAEIIFFCDADLIGIKPKIIEDIISPVKKSKYNMFIGLRKNFMQRTVHLFAINSGERAVRRVVWKELPKYFKYKYRVEAGLNYYVKNYFGGFGYKTFDYSQPVKEKKYGFLKGTFLRWAMNIDVLSAYFWEMIRRK